MNNSEINSKTYTPYPTDDAIKASFTSLCIDTLAQRVHCTPATMYKRLKQHNIIDDYIFKYYDSLHSQSLEYAVDSILELLENKENRKNYDKGISRRN